VAASLAERVDMLPVSKNGTRDNQIVFSTDFIVHF
jgi:hypothetical protein